jgi:hypothetical protein
MDHGIPRPPHPPPTKKLLIVVQVLNELLVKIEILLEL